ncbi:uncharacterized protein LOC120332556 isoform X1 [Styela clava]
MNNKFLLAAVALVMLTFTLEVAGKRGKYGLVNCKKSCVKRNCTTSSKPACKFECLRDCASKALVDHTEDEGRIWVGEEGSKHMCKRTCKKQCARKPPMCKHRCMANCTHHRHGNSSMIAPVNRRKLDNKMNKMKGGLRVPVFCVRECKPNCNETIQCTGNCLKRCDHDGAARIHKCKKRCKSGLECSFPACTECKVACLNKVSECWRARCDHLCHPDMEIDVNIEDADLPVKRKANKHRYKPAKACKVCRAECDRDGGIEVDSSKEIDH